MLTNFTYCTHPGRIRPAAVVDDRRPSGNGRGYWISSWRLCGSLQILFQGHGTVVDLIVRGIDQGYRTFFNHLHNRGDCLRILFQFAPIPPPKFHPFIGVMPKPGTQFLAGRDIPQPAIDLCSRFGQPARPKAFHEDALTIRRRKRQISAFNWDGCQCLSPTSDCHDSAVLARYANATALTFAQSRSRFFNLRRHHTNGRQCLR